MTMLERLARAIDPLAFYRNDDGGTTRTSLDLQRIKYNERRADARVAAREVLQALRNPDEGMLEAAVPAILGGGVFFNERRVFIERFQAAIDHILNEGAATE